MDHYKLFIDGEFVDAQDGKTFESIDPGNEAPIATVAQAGKADAEAAIAAARRAFDQGEWSGMTPARQGGQAVMTLPIRSPNRPCVWPSPNPWMPARSSDWPNIGACLVPGYCAIWLIMPPTDSPGRKRSPIPATSLPPAVISSAGNPSASASASSPGTFPASMAFWKIAQAIIMGNSIVLKPASVHAADRSHHRRGRQGGGYSQGGHQCPPRSGRGAGKNPLHPSGRGQDRLHRQHRSRAGDHAHGRRHGQESDPGVGGQIGQYHPGRCRYGSGRGRGRFRDLFPSGPDLRIGDAGAGAVQDL